MNNQHSFQNIAGEGTLYIVPTPIGNLDDITIRALNTLKLVDLIAAEDTRHTRKLLTHFDIHCALISYHEHSQEHKKDQLISQLEAGKQIALVSDAGMPGISDPGTPLIQAAIAKQIKVIVLPGANAALCALVGSGLDTRQFYFYGFLPRKNKEREQALTFLKSQTSTLLIYESPYRVKSTLIELEEMLGDRKATLARELTKKFEQYVRGSLSEIRAWSEANEVKGECCLVIEGGNLEAIEQSKWWIAYTVVEHIQYYMSNDELSSKEAIKLVAKDREMKKRDVYNQYHIE
ncbi:16S rRNA (cytidine1402-2'-O)-methyltransferase [Amphibacillus marinus]|uniref:Ribosomal RNA small subunit methyltransferase I n=1 Tax=Amphibacillus marinus TaxID=872970 RepID=A0A1H8PAQ5_9BACI|nr:16S rRNA (cytidine(1402)-2'-O)-methyltransferase [Amphibacillus marinus]SEO38804.1 16S rRNA (cytidine1402-2'-O)-methyltransferase [Amphibacillus marinus]